MKSQVFLPFYKKSRVLIAGDGNETILNELIFKTKNKESSYQLNLDYSSTLLNSTFFTNEKRNCHCCYIF